MKLVSQYADLQRVVRRLAQEKYVAYDSETTGLDPHSNKLVMLQFFHEGLPPVVVDWRKDDDSWGSALPTLDKLLWIGHNIKFDWEFLAARGFRIPRMYDTCIAEQVLYSLGKPPSLKEVVQKYCGVSLDKDGREWFYTPAPLDERPEWHEPFPTEQLEYACNDVLYLPAVAAAQKKLLAAKGLTRAAMLEMGCIPAVGQMELNGVYVVAGAWKEIIDEQAAKAERLYDELLGSKLAQAILEARARKYDEQLAALARWKWEEEHVIGCAKGVLKGECLTLDYREPWSAFTTTFSESYPTEGEKWGDFKRRVLSRWKELSPRPPTPDKKLKEVNLGSHDQLKMGLSLLGVDIPNTEAETLEKCVERYPVLRPLLDYRKAAKFVSTYGDKLLERINPVTGRIHPSFNQIGAKTGRMSSSQPNWQNIPARTKVGKRLRQCVQAEPGNVLLVADYSIIELRILSALSGDKTMQAMFASGADLHSFTARKMFNIPDDVDPATVEVNGMSARTASKQVNYGVAYGQTEWGFSRKNGVTTEVARGFIEQYFKLFGRAGRWLREQADAAMVEGYATTPTGRKLYFTLPEQSGNSYEERFEYDRAKGAIQRAAMNFPMQGGCADIVKMALRHLHEQLVGTEGRIVAVVHDEFVVEVPEEKAEVFAALVKTCMLDACEVIIPNIIVPAPDVHIGKCWEKP